jgi:hypothetical protein
MSRRPAEPVAIGYFPKRPTPRGERLSTDAVREICSVSECMAPGPERWVMAWRHNDWGCYDDPELAWSVVPDGERGDFAMFAYELFPLRFVDGEPEALAVAAPGVRPIPDSFEPLGYDVVSRGLGSFFECSPLSCNGWANEVDANAFCLLDDPAEAHRLASIAESLGYEPGNYHVLRVWRESEPRLRGPRA